MKKSILIFLLCFFISDSFSQDLIAVQNGAKQEFYESVDSAFANAADGDSLYFPGRAYTLPNVIDKKLHLFGVGFHPNYTVATEVTIFMNQLTIKLDASGGSISGVYFGYWEQIIKVILLKTL